MFMSGWRAPLPRRCAHDGREVSGLEAGAADEGPVDLLLPQQLRSVVRLYAAAVQNSDRLGGARPELAGGRLAENAADAVRLLAGTNLAGADRPNRLVGEDHSGDLLGSEPLETALDLPPYHRVRASVAALGEQLAAADDRDQTAGDRR